MQSKSTSLNGLTISYFETNPTAKNAVVFIHGNSSNKDIFLAQLESAAFRSMRMIALDLPGHGDSPRLSAENSGSYSLGFFAETIRDFLASLGVQHPVVVGHSLGGHVAIRLSRLIELSGLLLFQTPPLNSLEDLGQAFFPHEAGQFLFSENITEEQAGIIAGCAVSDPKNLKFEPILSIIKDGVLRTDPKSRAGVIGNLLAEKVFDEATQVRQLKCPVCVIHGRHDPLVNVRYIEGLALPNLWGREIIKIDGGHFPHMESFADFNRVVSEFALSVAKT